MLLVVLWVLAATAAASAIYVYRRSWGRAGRSSKDKPSLGTQLVAFVMLGMMSLRFAAVLHRGAVVTLPVAIMAISLIVLISFSSALSVD